MKKLMFLTMMFGLMMVFSGSVSAQQAIAEIGISIGDGAGTPAAGQQVIFDVHTRRNSEPNAPSGTKYLAFKFMKDGKQLTGGLMQLTPAQAKAIEGTKADKFTITKVENPLPIRKYDGLKVRIFNNNYAFIEVEVFQSGKKNLGKMKIHLKK